MATNGKTDIPVNDSEQHKASSAHAAINIPLNLENWRSLPEEVQDALTWYHQHVITERIGWDDVKNTIGYDRSTIFKILKGTYEGSWENVVARIAEYRSTRKLVKKSTFAPNRISRLISSGLDYAVASGGIVEIIGESGQGKSISGENWMHEHNSGRTTMVEVPPTGGHRNFLRAMVSRHGANKAASVIDMESSILRAYNARRVLILDEAHRLIPSERRTNPTSLEFIRHLHDQTGVPIGLLVTRRFDDQLRKHSYMFEQLIGRIDLPIQLPREMGDKDFGPLLKQYIKDPSPKVLDVCTEIVNNWDGRMRALDKLLKFASRIAGKAEQKMGEKHVFQALAWRSKLEKGDL